MVGVNAVKAVPCGILTEITALSSSINILSAFGIAKLFKTGSAAACSEIVKFTVVVTASENFIVNVLEVEKSKLSVAEPPETVTDVGLMLAG